MSNLFDRGAPLNRAFIIEYHPASHRLKTKLTSEQQRIEAVFISDLHLHPDDLSIQKRFNDFIVWAGQWVNTVYILGDFFHAWPGDDDLCPWSRQIAHQLNELTERGIRLFYLPGNRDFLLGNVFAQLAGWTVMKEPTMINLGDNKVMLVHGDGYCTKDINHQRFRRLTRNRLFKSLFLRLPLKYRLRLVSKVRQLSQEKGSKTMEQMDIVPAAVIKHMRKNQVRIVIHGHTHKPGLTSYPVDSTILFRYVLSDWDDTPLLLCYDDTKGLYFNQKWC